jgi:hypothetical protein
VSITVETPLIIIYYVCVCTRGFELKKTIYCVVATSLASFFDLKYVLVRLLALSLSLSLC